MIGRCILGTLHLESALGAGEFGVVLSGGVSHSVAQRLELMLSRANFILRARMGVWSAFRRSPIAHCRHFHLDVQTACPSKLKLTVSKSNAACQFCLGSRVPPGGANGDRFGGSMLGYSRISERS
jgi:hypothetical protein